MSAGDERPDPGAGAADIARTLDRVDHIVLATPDMEDTSDRLTTLLGVSAVPGGSHPAWGTRNMLVAIGDRTYLEVVGPDREAPPPEGPRPFGLDALQAPHLATWAVRGRALDALVARARADGIELGEVQRRTRRRPDGVLLGWSMTDLDAPRMGGVLPFFVDWGETPHPASTSPRGGTLVGLRILHPDPEEVRRSLRLLGLALEVEAADAPELVASLDTRRGRIEIW
jgi:catechol 2,3-dioxygenase-like lactoylglutathione lyase family enzyme